MWRACLVAPRHVGSSRTRAQTRVPCIGRRIPHHCTTREAPTLLFLTANHVSALPPATWSGSFNGGLEGRLQAGERRDFSLFASCLFLFCWCHLLLLLHPGSNSWNIPETAVEYGLQLFQRLENQPHFLLPRNPSPS